MLAPARSRLQHRSKRNDCDAKVAIPPRRLAQCRTVIGIASCSGAAHGWMPGSDARLGLRFEVGEALLLELDQSYDARGHHLGFAEQRHVLAFILAHQRVGVSAGGEAEVG